MSDPEVLLYLLGRVSCLALHKSLSSPWTIRPVPTLIQSMATSSPITAATSHVYNGTLCSSLERNEAFPQYLVQKDGAAPSGWAGGHPGW